MVSEAEKIINSKLIETEYSLAYDNYKIKRFETMEDVIDFVIANNISNGHIFKQEMYKFNYKGG